MQAQKYLAYHRRLFLAQNEDSLDAAASSCTVLACWQLVGPLEVEAQRVCRRVLLVIECIAARFVRRALLSQQFPRRSGLLQLECIHVREDELVFSIYGATLTSGR